MKQIFDSEIIMSKTVNDELAIHLVVDDSPTDPSNWREEGIKITTWHGSGNDASGDEDQIATSGEWYAYAFRDQFPELLDNEESIDYAPGAVQKIIEAAEYDGVYEEFHFSSYGDYTEGFCWIEGEYLRKQKIGKETAQDMIKCSIAEYQAYASGEVYALIVVEDDNEEKTTTYGDIVDLKKDESGCYQQPGMPDEEELDRMIPELDISPKKLEKAKQASWERAW